MSLTKEEEAFIAACKDPVFRLHNLYRISDKSARDIPFRPTPEQAKLIDAIYRKGQRRHVILKARQMGFSTLIELMLLDAAYFNAGINAAIVDKTQTDASKKLEEKIKFAFNRLPKSLRKEPIRENGSEIAWDFGSKIEAGMHVRGGTLQWLHISEWGSIAANDARRSREIKTGALPAAKEGIIIIESTMEGGQGGDFYEILKRAKDTPEGEHTELDFHFHFFPWYLDKTYTLDGPERAIPQDIHNYCDQKERELGITLTTGQRLWYTKTKQEQGIFMLREYPTTPEESYAAPVEGAIYADTILKIRSNGQIHDFLRNPSYPVYSCWDIGYSDDTAVWLFQIIGTDIHWLWHMSADRLTASEMWHRVSASGIPIIGNFLPHDAANHGPATGLSYKDALEKAGATNIRILPQTRDVYAGINAAMEILQRSYFHKTNCASGLNALEAYHAKENTTGKSILVHDWSSHSADAFRYGAEAIQLGLIKTHTARRIVADLDRYALAAGPHQAHGQVDLDALRQYRRRNRTERALSAIR